MMNRASLALAALLSGGVLLVPAALADSAEASCELRKDGETKQGASGACSFSQRQGYVDIDLRNGLSFNLKPTDEPNHFRDQEGKKVVRTVGVDGTHQYKWEGKKILVTFVEVGNRGNGHSGDTPHDLRDLAGGSYLGGEVDDQMASRGYRHVRNKKSGGEVWSYWRSDKGGHCVVVHMDGSRRVSSVVNAPAPDCKP
jgi:hypothetical protein